MKVRITLGLVIGMLFSCLSVSLVYATTDQSPMFTAESKNGAEKNVINLKKTPSPWLYINLPYSGRTSTTFWWTSPNNGGNYQSYKTTPKGSTSTESWYNFNDFDYTDDSDVVHDWSSVARTGTWDISATYSSPSKPSGQYNYSFTLVPEPISCTLFILGGAALGIKRYRKNRQNA